MDLDDDLDEQNSSAQYAVDTTAVSDKNSMQNFSYYGRRFMTSSQNKPMSPEPNAEDINSNTKFKNSEANERQGMLQNVMRQNSNVTKNKNLHEQTSQHTMSEAISYDGNHKRNLKQYNLEEKMNQGLMKQFKGMFEDDSQMQDSSRVDNVLNSYSEFNFSDHPGVQSRK